MVLIVIMVEIMDSTTIIMNLMVIMVVVIIHHHLMEGESKMVVAMNSIIRNQIVVVGHKGEEIKMAVLVEIDFIIVVGVMVIMM